jgi:flagellar biosynthetic protein FlhB
MAENSGQERTEEATPKKQREAREKGQLARSRELNSLLMLLSSAAALFFLGQYMLKGISEIIESAFVLDRKQLFDTKYMISILTDAVVHSLFAIAPFLIMTVIVAFLSSVLLGGFAFSTQALGFKWEKVDPIKGFKRVFGPQGLMELFKAFAKFSIVVTVVIIVLWMYFEQIVGLSDEPLEHGLAHAAELVLWSFLITSCGLFFVAAVDVPFQIWNHNKQLKMTKQEVKDEYKDTEGKPEVKRRIRETQMAMAQKRMMAEVPKADVVITNPTHYAVALKYDPKKMAAPIVVAKGADLIAAEIRRVATEANVPLMASPALARSIYHTTEIDAPIPEGLYKAVAMVLAYIFQTKQKGRRYRTRPLSMQEVPIPDELRRDH